MMYGDEKTYTGFGCITQVIPLYTVCGELMPHARCHALMSPNYPTGSSLAGSSGSYGGHRQMATLVKEFTSNRIVYSAAPFGISG